MGEERSEGGRPWRALRSQRQELVWNSIAKGKPRKELEEKRHVIKALRM